MVVNGKEITMSEEEYLYLKYNLMICKKTCFRLIKAYADYVYNNDTETFEYEATEFLDYVALTNKEFADKYYAILIGDNNENK